MKKGLLERDDTYCLKGICMLMIIIGHTYNGYPVGQSGYFFPEALKCLGLAYWGGFGVSVFMFLSGYGMFLSLQRSSVDAAYAVRKCRRLFEPFVMYWLVELLVLLLLDAGAIDGSVLRDVCTLSIYPHIENWFFKVIIVLYALIIVLFLVPVRDGMRVAVLFLASASFAVAAHWLGLGGWWYNNIMLFPLGALVAYRRAYFERHAGGVLLTVLVLMFFASWLLHVNLIVTHALFGLTAVLAIRYVNVSSRLLHYVGANSFVFYFMECPSMDQLAMFAYRSFSLYCFLSLLLTAVLSVACVTVSNKIH